MRYKLFLLTLFSFSFIIAALAQDSDASLRQKAIVGDAEAQYNYGLSVRDYAIWNNGDRMSESLDWLKSSANQGHEKANAFLGLLSLAEGDLKKSTDYLSSVHYSSKIVDDLNTIYLSTNGIKILATYLSENPNVSITKYGPMGNDAPFVIEKNDTIYVCASKNGKAGLLKLDMSGNRIGHDDIPLAYDYIVPMYGEALSLSDAVKDAEYHICFIVSPYFYKIQRNESTIRCLNIFGQEQARSIWGSEAARVLLPKNYFIDSEKGSFIGSE